MSLNLYGCQVVLKNGHLRAKNAKVLTLLNLKYDITS